MSVVLGSSREVPVSPTVGLQGDHGGFGGGAASEMTRVSTTATEKESMALAPASCFLEVVHKEKCTASMFIKLESASNSSKMVNVCSRTCDREEEEEEEEEEADEDDDQDGEIDDDEDVRFKFKGALSSMGALEESLPIKRGLSNFFNGKSKSFANLSEVTAVKDLAKPEMPFNKRRRTLIARSWRPRRPFHTTSLTSFASVPAFSSTEEEEEEEGAAGQAEIATLGAREILHERF